MNKRERLCILLLEDSPLDRFIVQHALLDASPVHFHLLEVDRLSEALALLREEPVDLILTDLNLPDSFGLESVRALLKESSCAPLWVLTGSIDPDMATQFIHEGACGCLSKNQLDSPELHLAIGAAIQHKHAMDFGAS